MQRDLVIQQLKEEAQKVAQHATRFEQDGVLKRIEAEQFLNDVEKLYRNLAVYTHVLKHQGDLQVHLKIMQSVAPAETPTIPEEKEEPVQLTIEEKVEEIMAKETKENTNLKRVEFSINDRFRVINELFFHSQQEFQVALQQLNAISTIEESIFYLDSLKQIYGWKSDGDLVKTFYAMVNKRFV